MQGRIQRQKAETGTSTIPVASGRVSNSSSTSSVAGRIQRQMAETQPSASVVDSKVPEVKKTSTKKNSKRDDIGIGIGAGLLETASWMSSLGEKALQAPLKLFGAKFDKKTSAQKLQSLVEQKTKKEEGTLFEPENETQAIAKTVEQIAEYFIPGGLAVKAGKAAKATALLSKAPKFIQKIAPYAVEGITDAALSTPLVLKNTQNASEEDRDSELAWNAGIAAVAPGLMKVAGKALKPLGRIFRKRKAIEETIEEASKLADEIAPKAKSVDGIAPPKASNLDQNIDKGINIPQKGITDQNGAVLDLRQADNTKSSIAGRVQREAIGQKESRFAQTVAKSDITDPALKTAIKADAPVYDVVTNSETQRRALSRIASEGTERAASFVRNAPEPDADVVTTGVELIKKYQADKQFDLAADMAADVSERLSKSGQAIQAAKIYENLSPESVLVKAQRFIKEQNAKNTLFSGKQKLTEADAEKLYELAQKMQSLNGDAKTELAAEIGGILGSYKRTSVGKKLSSAQTQAQLLNPKTAMRNIIGNELFYRLERLTKILATPIDIVRSKLTGTERTITFRAGNQEKFWKNWMKGARAGWKGLDLGPSTVYDIKNHTFKNKLNPFYWGEKAVGAMLKSFDYAAYKRAYGETLYELAYLKAKKEGLKGAKLKQRAIKLLDSMDAQAHELADKYGKYVTFQDDSVLAKGSVQIKKALNLGQDFGLGDLILKYPRTPANLLDRALDYSPVGFVKSFKTIAEPILFGAKKGVAQNREIAMATARALVGTLGFTGFGYFLADKGMITGKRSSNRNINSLEEEMGKGEYKINVSAIKRFVMSGFKNTRIQDGDTYFTYDWAQPVSVALSIGANMNGGTAGGVVENVVSGVNTIVEQPLLSGVLNLLKYGDITKSLTTTMEGAGSSFTPTLLNQFRQYTDNIKRQTRGETFGETFVNRIENRIPGQSTELAPQVGALGNVKQNFENNNIFNVFLNPGNVTTYKEIPEAKLVLDLIEQTGENKHAPKVIDKTATLFGRPEILTPEEQAAMQQYAGREVMKSLDIAVNSEKFKALPPEEQVDVISRKLTEIGSNIRAILMARRAHDAKKAGDEEAIKFMQENVSPTDVTRFNAAYQYLKTKNPFEIQMPEKEEKKEELIDKVDKGALPALGVGLGLAIATKGKKTEMLEKELSKVAPKLTTKILEFFTGKGDVSRQFVEDLLKKDGISKVEKEIVSKTLSTEGSKVNTTLFARKVVDELLPLKIKEDTLKGKWEKIALNEDLRGDVQRYAEHIYESPYSTNAGKIHFEGRTEKYFGHVRLEDHPDDVRRIIEVQSDLYQKGRIDTYENGEAMQMLLDDPVKYKANQGVAKKRLEELDRLKQYNDPSAHFRMVREEVKKAAEDGKKKLQFPTGKTGMRIEKLGAEISEEIFEGKDVGDIVDLQERAWEIQYIDRADKEVYLIPDGAMEQLQSDLYDDAIKSAKENYPDWFDKKGRLLEEYEDDVEDILEEIVEESDELAQMTERFTFGGLDHENPIYKFYDSTLGKYLKNNYNAKVVTDSKGITWNEIEIKPEYAKKPVQAFGLAGLSTGSVMQSSEDEDKRKKGAVIAGVGAVLALRGNRSTVKTGFREVTEKIGKLLATHSTTKEGIEGILKDKKIWGPSVAVFDKEKVEKMFGFGNYHMVVNKKSIDPSNKDVMMFTDDVFSPRMISSEASVKQLAEDLKTGKDIIGGEIDKGEIPIHTLFADRIESFDDLYDKAKKLGTRDDARNSYLNLYATVTNGFEDMMPGEMSEVLGSSRLSDEAESIIRALAKRKELTPEAFRKEIKDIYGFTPNKQDAEEYISSVREQLTTFRAEYFEAKVLRGLDLNEIDTVLVPASGDIDTLMKLQNAGMKTEIYHDIAPTEERKKSLREAFNKVSGSAFGIGIIPFGFKSKKMLEQKLAELTVRRDQLKKENEELALKVEKMKAARDEKPATITVYNPDPSQTDSTPNEGSFLTKMEFGDIAIGNRDEHTKAKQLFFKEGKDTFVIIPELAKVKTPYGNGKFRVRDTMNLRYDGEGRVDIFIPDGMEEVENLVRKTPKGTYFYPVRKEDF